MQTAFWQLSSYHLTATELSHKNTYTSGYQSSMLSTDQHFQPSHAFQDKAVLGQQWFLLS